MKPVWEFENYMPSRELVIDLIRPASKKTIIAFLAYLAQFRPMFQTDSQQQTAMISKYAEDLTGISEVALHDAFNAFLAMDGKYYPEPSVLLGTIREKDKCIKNVKNVFNALQK